MWIKEIARKFRNIEKMQTTNHLLNTIGICIDYTLILGRTKAVGLK